MGIAPGAQPPEGAFVIGDEPYGADVTEESMKQMYRGQVSAGYEVGADGFRNGILGGFGSILGFISQLFGGLSGTSGGGFLDLLGSLLGTKNKTDNIVTNLFNGWFGGGSTGSAGEVATTVSAIKSAIFGNLTVYTLTGSGNFTVPACASMWVIPINGGSGGQAGANTGSSDPVPGGNGGQHGGYVARKFTPADVGGVGALVPYACGNAGAGGSASNFQLGGTGGVTRFGPSGSPFWVGQSGIGGIQDAVGFLATSSVPGAGGQGGRFDSTTGSRVGTAGDGTPLATGGTGGSGSGGAGGAGAAASVTDTPAGGGGGGGGGGNSGFLAGGGNGGVGGNYGAGGGGGGSCGNTAAKGNGGNGAPGVIYILAA